MNCAECKQNIYQLIEREDNELTREMEDHLAVCPHCRKEYDEMMQIVEIIRKGADVKAPENLQGEVLKQVETIEKKSQKQYKIMRMAMNTAAILAIAILIPVFATMSNANAADKLLKDAITALQNVGTMFIEMDARTLPEENFAYINAESPMVSHTIYKDFGGNTRWKISKPGRIVLMQNDTTRFNFPQRDIYLFIDQPAQGALEWFGILLQPSQILQKELVEAKIKSNKTIVKEKNGLIYLTVISKAEGNFLNDYTKNSSITESDNRREYIFDKKNNLLKSLKIYLWKEHKEILIVNIHHIDYNKPFDDTIFNIPLAKGKQWEKYNIEKSKNEKISNLTPKQFATLVFKLLENKDLKTYAEIWQTPESISKLIYKKYMGSKLIHLGEPFKSGKYVGYFVPYEIKLLNGKTKKHNLAIRNDNANSVWQVDGGL